MDEEAEPRKTREVVFKHIGSAQLPNLLLEIDAATHVSVAPLARRPSFSSERLAVYGTPLAHRTDPDAKGVGSMIPGIDAAHIFRGTFRFNVERCADVLVERAAGKGVARPSQ